MNTSQIDSRAALSPAVDVLIVGAGICGLLAAARLVARGLRVLILDKGRSVGGRMATRRVGLGVADHGAQFFTARDSRFAALVDQWRTENLLFRWSNGWSDGSLGDARPGDARLGDGHPRFAVQGGMNALPKHLAAALVDLGVQIQTGVQVTAVAVVEDGWQVQAVGGGPWRCRGLVLTAPAPQALALLAPSAAGRGAALDDGDREALQRIAYAPCLCALCAIDGRVWLPAPGAVQRPQADISWIADNQRKGISPYAPVFTLHGSPAWSAAHSQEPDEALLESFRGGLDEWASGKIEYREIQIKRWRYALPVVLHPQPFLRAGGLPPLYFGGDAFGSPRIEGAALSGLAIGDALSVL